MAKLILPSASNFLKLALQKIIFDRRQRTNVNLVLPTLRTRAKMATRVGDYPPLKVVDVTASTASDFLSGGTNGLGSR